MVKPPDADGPGRHAGSTGVWDERAQGALLAALLESSDDAIIGETADGIVISWNAAASRMFGYTAAEMLGRPITRLIPEGRESEQPFVGDRIRRGERVARYETLRRHKSGRLVSVALTIAPVFGAKGEVIGAAVIARDTTERKRLEEAQRLLDREINHRSKNLLAMVDAIIRQTVSREGTEEFSKRITERLRALAANQDLLIESSWRGAEMRELVYSQLVQVDGPVGGRVRLSGDAIMVTPVAAQALGMAFHELASNAVSYGALSVPEGRVEVSWAMEPDSEPEGGVFVVNWRESGGPNVALPDHAGFGTTIIERITGQALGGQVVMTYAPTGLEWELRAPAEGLVGHLGEAGAPAPPMDVAGM